MSTEPTNAPTRATHAHGSPAAAASRNAVNTASLATKPSSGGRPAIEAAATIAIVAITGIRRPSPESLRQSRVPAAWSTMPTTRKSAALNRACASSRVTPASAASRVPYPVTSTRKPSWLTVP